MHAIDSLKRAMAVVVCCAIATSGCATAQGPRVAPASAGHDRVVAGQVLREYVQRLAPGAPVRVDRASARSVRGTLIKATADAIVIQPRTRVAVPPVTIPMDDVLRVTPDSGNGNTVVKAIAIGAAAGAGAALAVFAIIAAVLAD